MILIDLGLTIVMLSTAFLLMIGVYPWYIQVLLGLFMGHEIGKIISRDLDDE